MPSSPFVAFAFLFFCERRALWERRAIGDGTIPTKLRITGGSQGGRVTGSAKKMRFGKVSAYLIKVTPASSQVSLTA